MLQYLSDLVVNQAQNPWLQAILLGLATFVAEDPAILLASSLSAAGLVSTLHAFAGILIGIAVGDPGSISSGPRGLQTSSRES